MAALTPIAIAQIELWMAMDGESPAVQRLYLGMLGRAGSSAEVSFYSPTFVSAEGPAAAANGATYAGSTTTFLHDSTIINYFLDSQEFKVANPNVFNADPKVANPALINLLYNNSLGRAPTAAETTFYTNFMNGGGRKQQVIAYITGSPEAIAHAAIIGQ